MTGLLDRRRLVLTLALLFSLTGFLLWQTMDRREDPRMPAYWGQVVVSFPGADAETVERLRAAIERRSLDDMQDVSSKLDDIVFYVQDAT